MGVPCANKADERARGRAYYLRHRARKLAYQRMYRKKNAARVKASLRRWYLAHRDEVLYARRLNRVKHTAEMVRFYYRHKEKILVKLAAAYKRKVVESVPVRLRRGRALMYECNSKWLREARGLAE